MMKSITLRFIFLYIFLIPSLAQATIYYVCHGGSNSAPTAGTCDGAWDEGDFNTASNWANVKGGDTIYLMDNGGTFTDQLKIQKAGSSAVAPIIIAPAPGADVVITDTNSGYGFQTQSYDYITIACNLDGGSLTINMDNATSYHSGINVGTSENVIIDGCTIVGPGYDGATVVGTVGINSKGNNHTFTNNIISDTNVGIVYNPSTPGVHTVLIAYNTITDMTNGPADASDCIGLKDRTNCCPSPPDDDTNADFSGVVVEYNYLAGWQDDGIDMRFTQGVTLRYNEFTTDKAGCVGPNAIKSPGSDYAWPGQAKIYGNYIHDLTCYVSSPGDTKNVAINTGATKDHSIYGNLIENVVGTGIFMKGAVDNEAGPVSIHNNTIVNVTDSSGSAAGDGWAIWAGGISVNDVTIRNNIVDGENGDIDVSAGGNLVNFFGGYNILVNDVAVSEQGSDNYENTDDTAQGATDPHFTDAAAGDFTLKTGSPAIDAGAYIDTPFNEALLPGSEWPAGVIAVDPNFDRTRREIGVYFYTNNAAESSKGVSVYASVQKDGTSLRSGPSTEHMIIRSVDSGYPVTILAQQEQWVLIDDFREQKGCILKKLIGEAQTIVIKVRNANLHKGPNLNDEIAAELDYGSILWIEGKNGDWVKVSSKDGLNGWLYKEVAWPSMK